jgi:hypothetical protein
MTRTFTLGEAQELLPVLDGLLRQAIEASRRAERLEAEFAQVRDRIMVCGGLEVDVLRLARRRAEQDKTVQGLQDALAEIEASGAQVKDLDLGLLDFPCVVGDRVILLCWRLGERRITHWHGTGEGYSSRRLIDERMVRAQARPKPS